MFKGSQDIVTKEDAYAYIRSRMFDAVGCYNAAKQNGVPFPDAITWARYLAKCW